MASGDLFGIMVMLVAAGVVIAFLDWVERNFTVMHGPTLRERNEKPPAENLEAGSARGGQRASDTQQFNQTIQTEINNSLNQTGGETLPLETL